MGTVSQRTSRTPEPTPPPLFTDTGTALDTGFDTAEDTAEDPAPNLGLSVGTSVSGPYAEGGYRTLGHHRELFFSLIAGVVVATTVGAYLADPTGLGGVAETVVSLVLFVVLGVAPFARGVHPTWTWLPLLGASAALIVSKLDPLRGLSVGPLEAYNIPHFFVYGFLLLWLTLLPWHVGGGHPRLMLMDSFAASAGGTLAIWCVLRIPLGDTALMITGFFRAFYPPVDIIMLVLAVHLASRMGTMPHAMRWLLGGIVMWIAVDTAYAWSAASSGDATVPVLDAAYLVSHFCFAMAASRPDVVELSRPAKVRGLDADVDTRVVNLILTLLPIILCVWVPVRNNIDAWARTILVSVVAIVVYIRIVHTMAALSNAEKSNAERANRDALTGLYNRAALVAHLEHLLTRNGVEGRRTAVYYFDCDRFKNVNDTFGHHVGDNLLREVAKRLTSRLPGNLMRARQGGDEFVLVETVRTPQQAIERAGQLLDLMREPAQITKDKRLVVTPSVGVVVTEPGEDLAVDELLFRADLAMFDAKRAGGDQYVMYEDALAHSMRLQADAGSRAAGTVDRARHRERHDEEPEEPIDPALYI